MTTDTLLRECRAFINEFGDPANHHHVELAQQVDAQLAAPEGVCPHIVTSKEGTSYCRLAESTSAQDERGRVIEEWARVCDSVWKRYGDDDAAKICASEIRALAQPRADEPNAVPQGGESTQAKSSHSPEREGSGPAGTAPVAPDNEVRVPVEPTDAMVMAGDSCCPITGTNGIRYAWKRMLAAAPSAKQRGEGRGE